MTTHQPLSRLARSGTPARRLFKRGELIHLAGDSGPLQRIVSGAVRLDLPTGNDVSFASLALAGDLLGIESLAFGGYGFTARALTPCTLEIHEPEEVPLAQMALATQRAAQTVALRDGPAAWRIQRLAALLTAEGAQPLSNRRHLLPRLADIAEITGLTVETVSRTTATLGSACGLPHKTYRQRATPQSGFAQALAA